MKKQRTTHGSPKPAWIDKVARHLHQALRDQRVYTAGELAQFLDLHRIELSIPGSLTLRRFTEALEGAGVLHQVRIEPANRRGTGESYKPFSRYVWPDATARQVAISLRSNSFFSHATAAHLHGLLTAPPDAIYLNKEQSEKSRPTAQLTQPAIDMAFSNEARASKYIYVYQRQRLVLISGKHTANYGIEDRKDETGFSIRLTDLERTLVDIAVRPIYAGGVEAILEVYRKARNDLSVAKIASTLAALDYVYPYHQAIGFYLSRAGIPESKLAPLRSLEIKFNFYLCNRLSQPVLNEQWRVYVPGNL